MKKIWSGMMCGLLLTAGCAATQSFTVRTNPPGADIYVDGERVGKTPATSQAGRLRRAAHRPK